MNFSLPALCLLFCLIDLKISLVSSRKKKVAETVETTTVLSTTITVGIEEVGKKSLYSLFYYSFQINFRLKKKKIKKFRFN